jgi:protein-L-isoaspartate(D-aspartate) O-methyltransferase
MEKDLVKSRKKLFSSLKRNMRSESVIQVMERVPRERFVPPESRHLAYLDLPLSISEGQTISQPYIVALMVAALGLQGHEKVLEVGTGSGYQAAILSLLVPQGRVCTVELVPNLAERARKLLRELGYDNVGVELAGPTLGCSHHAPFDAIIVAAASPKLPESLVSQLAVGGRLVIPVGTLEQQDLVHAIRTDEGLSVHMMEPCRFVPLIGREAFPKIQ